MAKINTSANDYHKINTLLNEIENEDWYFGSLSDKLNLISTLARGLQIRIENHKCE